MGKWKYGYEELIEWDEARNMYLVLSMQMAFKVESRLNQVQ